MTKEIMDAVMKSGYQKFDPTFGTAGIVGEKCPDDGACHHECKHSCFRVLTCGPLSDVYPNDEWPRNVVLYHHLRQTTVADATIEQDDEVNTCTYLSVVEHYHIVEAGKVFKTAFYSFELSHESDNDEDSVSFKVEVKPDDLFEFAIQLLRLAKKDG